jgi:hypothetical protein
MRNLVLLLVLFLGVAACSESKPPEKTVFDTQVQALKKARAVESKVQEGADKQREAIEQSESGSSGTPPSSAQTGY